MTRAEEKAWRFCDFSMAGIWLACAVYTVLFGLHGIDGLTPAGFLVATVWITDTIAWFVLSAAVRWGDE